MQLQDLNKEYDLLQKKYGAKSLNSIYSGGWEEQPDLCFVFMNPTGKNPASLNSWKGIRAPWLGTKTIWDLFYALDLLDSEIYNKIKSIKGKDWTEEFAFQVYEDIKKHKYFITNLGKCTQVDARALPDSVYLEYLHLLEKEIAIINPKVIVLFGNQVSSVVLNQKIAVSKSRKKRYDKVIQNKTYACYPVYYPVGNGRFHMSQAIEDLRWILERM